MNTGSSTGCGREAAPTSGDEQGWRTLGRAGWEIVMVALRLRGHRNEGKWRYQGLASDRTGLRARLVTEAKHTSAKAVTRAERRLT